MRKTFSYLFQPAADALFVEPVPAWQLPVDVVLFAPLQTHRTLKLVL